jgi:hypothetical protein
MTFWPLLVCTICYAATSAGFAYEKNWPMCGIFAGYFAANCGIPLAGVAVNKPPPPAAGSVTLAKCMRTERTTSQT